MLVSYDIFSTAHATKETKITHFRLAKIVVKYGSYDGITNWTFPLDLYKKCRSTVPGITSVEEGLPLRTADRISAMLPFVSSSCRSNQNCLFS